MRTAALSTVAHLIRTRHALPFSVRNQDCTLLLARGQMIDSESQLHALFERGALVDMDEVNAAATLPPPGNDAVRRVHAAPLEALPGMWNDSTVRLGEVLGDVLRPGQPLDETLQREAEVALALVDREPDLAVFRLVQQAARGQVHYGVSHSVDTAVACWLVSHRLGWDRDTRQTLFKAALTMNLGMLDLQAELVEQHEPLSDAQRQAVHDHPWRSVEQLERSGVTDADWLAAVAAHHEETDGTGYPRGLTDVAEMAQLIRRADVYCAKLSARAGRSALRADEAARRLYQQAPGETFSQAIIKEFGIYPPGTPLRLETGEWAIAVRRGTVANHPRVAVVADRHGMPLAHPVPRDTGRPGHHVAQVADLLPPRVRIDPVQMAMLAAA